jgi:hypothetical protein
VICSSAPLPPVTRIEDRAQTRKCSRLRKTLSRTLADALESYIQVSAVVRGFAEQTDLEKYLDIYEISDFDISDANNRSFSPVDSGHEASSPEDAESLRALKIATSRLHTVRKVFLCSLLALDASGESNDLLRWTAAVEALRSLNQSTRDAYVRLRDILSQEECKF